MFTDMVGYTLLGQRNESLSIALVEEQRKLIRPILNKHNGREVKTIGDAFLVEFPSALDATRCAYDIQRATREFNISLPEERRVHLRIGVHLGDVLESQGDISGDAVNVASRIEHLAEDGGVCLTRQVYDHIQNKFDLPLKSLGPKSLKNVDTPIEVYRMRMPWDEDRASQPTQLNKLRIAVLPFANMSPDLGDEYFADGMTEELIDRLSQVRELRVIARTSVMGYKKKEMKVSEIAKELAIGTLVEGSIRKAGNKIRITVQLVDTETEEHLWSSRYDKDLDDVFAIQSEISERVTNELRVRLLDSEKRLLERRPTENTDAYMLYLKGRYYWSERTKPSLEKGIAYLQKALQADPNLAVAYSDLADVHVIMADYGIMRGPEAYAKVREYATKALEVDPSLSQPHAALGTEHERSFRWAEAENEYKLAIKLNPNNATAHHWYALHLSFKRKENAMQEWRKAKELDPLSLIIGSAFGYFLVWQGHKEEGLAMLRSVIELNDGFVAGHQLLAFACIVAGMKAEAVKEAKKMMDLTIEADYPALAACVYAEAGETEEAVAILNTLLKQSDTHYVDPSEIAMIYAALRNEAKALEWLEKAVNEKSAGIPYIHFFPMFEFLRDDPRFKQIYMKMGLGIAN